MSEEASNGRKDREDDEVSSRCPVCGEPLLHEKCKVVCRSERCVYRIVFNCAEM